MSYLNADRFNSAHKKKFHGRNWERQVPNFDPSIAGKRFLVLDDEFLIALDIQQILEAAGAAAVRSVATADEALALLRADLRFDLAVLDVKLSGATRDSRSVAAFLSGQKIPFVFLTGMHRQDGRIRQFPDAPVVDKPYATPLLLDAIMRALGR
jgi:CheY-like chemotaxis protein